MHEREWSVYYCLNHCMGGNPRLLHAEGIKKMLQDDPMTANFAL
jgi:hypothetical protein